MIWPDKIRKEKQREKRSDGELVTLRLFTICVIGAVALNGKRKAQIRSACSLLGAWKRVCKAHLEVIDHRCHTNPGSAEIKGVSNWSAGCRTKALRPSRTESNKLCKHVVVSRRQRKKLISDCARAVISDLCTSVLTLIWTMLQLQLLVYAWTEKNINAT